MKRTLSKDTPELVGKKINLQGWIKTIRDHGKIVFVDLRDRTGTVQLVGGKDLKPYHPEDVVEVEGVVRDRPQNLINKKILTGKIEVNVTDIILLNQAKELPFPIDTDGYSIDEELRLRYRYLDLRRDRLQKNIKIRSQYVQAARQFLLNQDFTEIETPLLTKSTPEGSRDFIVPSRLNFGKFYALPQSPQQYKQLLMTAGFERYFQLARCLRDEDPRADRGFEHTQIDIEMSFVKREDVMELVESMTVHALEAIGGSIVKKPFPVVTYQEAMKKYGADKFDLRSKKEQEQRKMSFAWVIDFPFFEKDTEGNWTFTHNPFSQPVNEYHEKMLLQKKDIGKILTSQYDLVCNGFEVAGGSIRSHKSKVLEAVFEILGYDKLEIQNKFGHMLEAFQYGTPPHGGCAQGFERLLMAYFGENYLREVQAFPQTGKGRTSVMDAPSELEQKQLDEIHLALINVNKHKSGEEILNTIVESLKTNKMKFKQYTHEAVYTSEQAAKVRNTPLKQGAKALVMIADKKPIMVVISASTKVDGKILKKYLKIRDLRMASKEEVKQLTHIEVGAIPPFGHLFSLATYMDKKLSENKKIDFNAGLHTKSIEMLASDYISLENPTIALFSKS
jgi:aspartyl-tRNA synthetase